MLQLTRNTWISAFMTALGRADEEIDTPRIQQAFKEALVILKEWPSPAQIIELMPRRPEPKRILYDPPADPARAQSAFAIAIALAGGEISKDEADRQLKQLMGGNND